MATEAAIIIKDYLNEEVVQWDDIMIDGLANEPWVMGRDSERVQATGKPYVIFNWSSSDQGNDFYLNKEMAIFILRAPDQGTVNQAVKKMKSALKQLDWSARNINDWMDRDNPRYAGIDFKYVSLITATAAEPTEGQSAYFEGIVSIDYTYTDEADNALFNV